MMVGIKTKENMTEEPKAERARTFGTVSTKTTEANPREEQTKAEATAKDRPTADHEEATIELGDLMAKLNQIDKKLKHSEEDREVIRKELRYNKHEYLDSYFNLAKATDERLKEMSDKVEATNEERDKNIKKDMQQLKNRYDDVNSQLGSLEKRMDTMSKNQAESSCAIQAKLDAILRNSTSQERPAADRTQGTRVDFVEPQRNNSSLRKATSMGPKKTKKSFSVNMVSTRSTTENRAKEGTEGERVEPTIEIDLETPDQSVDETGKIATESTPMPNAEEPNPKPIEFSPIDNVEDAIGNSIRKGERRLSSKKDIFYRKVGDDGRNKNERKHD